MIQNRHTRILLSLVFFATGCGLDVEEEAGDLSAYSEQGRLCQDGDTAACEGLCADGVQRACERIPDAGMDCAAATKSACRAGDQAACACLCDQGDDRACSRLGEPEEEPTPRGNVYANDFDGSPLGTYTRERALAEFPDVDQYLVYNDAAQVVAGPEAFAGRSMRVEVFDGTIGRGSMNIKFRIPGGGYDDLYTSFMYTTSPNFKTNTGGKLNALAGAAYSTKYSQGGCLEDGEFNSKPHLSGSGQGTHNYSFFYGMKNRCGGGTGFWWDGADGSSSNSGPNINSAHGVWHHIEYRIKVNTPGKADGILQTWHDGELVLSNTSMMWRKTDAHNVERAKLQAFVSGGNEIEERGHFIYYDDYVISTERQGPPVR